MAASALGRKPSMSRVDEEDALPLSPNDCLALERSALERNDPPLSYSNPLTHSGTSTDTAILSEDRPLVFVRHRRWHIYLGVALAFLTLVAISVGTAAVVSLAKAGKTNTSVCATSPCVSQAAYMIETSDTSADPCDDFYQVSEQRVILPSHPKRLWRICL